MGCAALILDILKNCIATAKTPDEAVLNIQKSLSGAVYIPNADRITRNAEIRAFYNGENGKETCEQFKISTRTLYRVINHK
jgi:Mor family transcriptional regulator